VLFPPGCYGSYLIRCLYSYTNLRKEDYVPFLFDSDGSSHSIRDNKSLQNYFKMYHKQTLPDSISPSIVILPDDDHNLDYFNNQFTKQSKRDINEFVVTCLAKEEIKEKLKIWGVDSIEDSPNWIFREFISLWISEVLSSSYNIDSYAEYNGFKITTKDIFLNFIEKIQEAIEYLKLTQVISVAEISNNHDMFISAQKYHNSQLNTAQWIDSVFYSKDNIETPCKTIFDEAYAQFLLREKGYELKCYNLNTFPKDSNSLKEIINAS